MVDACMAAGLSWAQYEPSIPRALKSNVFSNKTNKMWVYPQLEMKIRKSDG